MSDLPRLLFCCFDVVPAPSAISRRLTEYLKGLSERFQVVVLSVKTPDHAHIERYHGARLLRVPVGSGDFMARVQAFDRAVRRQLESEEYLVVHFFDPFGGYALAERRGELGYKLVYDACAFPSLEMAATQPDLAANRRFVAKARRQELFCLMNADAVIVGSPLTREWVGSLGVDLSTVHLLPAPVDLAPYTPEAMGRPDATVMKVLHVGSLSPHHGLPLLLEAAALAVTGEHPVELSVTVVGPQNPEWRARLDEQVTALGLTGRVDFQAPVTHDDLHKVLATADVGLLSLEDNERNRVVGSVLSRLGEYLAAGRPVVAADLPAARQLCPPDAVAWFDPGSASSLAGTLRTLALDPAKRVELGAAARVASEKWDGMKIRADLIAVYTAITGQTVQRAPDEELVADPNEPTQLGLSLVPGGEVTQAGARALGATPKDDSAPGTNKVKVIVTDESSPGTNKVRTDPAIASPDSNTDAQQVGDRPAVMGVPIREDAPVIAGEELPAPTPVADEPEPTPMRAPPLPPVEAEPPPPPWLVPEGEELAVVPGSILSELDVEGLPQVPAPASPPPVQHFIAPLAMPSPPRGSPFVSPLPLPSPDSAGPVSSLELGGPPPRSLPGVRVGRGPQFIAPLAMPSPPGGASWKPLPPPLASSPTILEPEPTPTPGFIAPLPMPSSPPPAPRVLVGNRSSGSGLVQAPSSPSSPGETDPSVSVVAEPLSAASIPVPPLVEAPLPPRASGRPSPPGGRVSGEARASPPGAERSLAAGVSPEGEVAPLPSGRDASPGVGSVRAAADASASAPGAGQSPRGEAGWSSPSASGVVRSAPGESLPGAGRTSSEWSSPSGSGVARSPSGESSPGVGRTSSGEWSSPSASGVARSPSGESLPGVGRTPSSEGWSSPSASGARPPSGEVSPGVGPTAPGESWSSPSATGVARTSSGAPLPGVGRTPSSEAPSTISPARTVSRDRSPASARSTSGEAWASPSTSGVVPPAAGELPPGAGRSPPGEPWSSPSASGVVRPPPGESALGAGSAPSREPSSGVFRAPSGELLPGGGRSAAGRGPSGELPPGPGRAAPIEPSPGPSGVARAPVAESSPSGSGARPPSSALRPAGELSSPSGVIPPGARPPSGPIALPPAPTRSSSGPLAGASALSAPSGLRPSSPSRPPGVPPPLPSGAFSSSASRSTLPPPPRPPTNPGFFAPLPLPPISAPPFTAGLPSRLPPPPAMPIDEVLEIADSEVESMEVEAEPHSEEEVIAADEAIQAVESDSSAPPSGLDPWLAQVAHGYCPPGSNLFDRHVPPTTMPGRDPVKG